MGTNNIPQANDGEIIPASDHNAIRNALTGDLVPRNASGSPQDDIGSVGSSTYWWNNLFAKIFKIKGSKDISILEESGSFKLKFGTTVKAEISEDGLIGSFIKDGSISKSKLGSDANFGGFQTFLSDGNFTVPAGVTRILAYGCGGGGGAGGTINNAVFITGGGGATFRVDAVSVTPGEILTVVIGPGGATNGGNGGTTQLKRGSTVLLSFQGGNGGILDNGNGSTITFSASILQSVMNVGYSGNSGGNFGAFAAVGSGARQMGGAPGPYGSGAPAGGADPNARNAAANSGAGGGSPGGLGGSGRLTIAW